MIIKEKIGANGIGDNNPINQQQVDLCKIWIERYVKPIETINKKMSSYQLKHNVEQDYKERNGVREYISNGAFIQAAIEQGYQYEKHGDLNAYFNMSFVKVK